jgi:hypothetical protein
VRCWRDHRAVPGVVGCECPGDIVSFYLGLVFVADGGVFSETIVSANPAWFPT